MPGEGTPSGKTQFRTVAGFSVVQSAKGVDLQLFNSFKIRRGTAACFQGNVNEQGTPAFMQTPAQVAGLTSLFLHAQLVSD